MELEGELQRTKDGREGTQSSIASLGEELVKEREAREREREIFTQEQEMLSIEMAKARAAERVSRCECISLKERKGGGWDSAMLAWPVLADMTGIVLRSRNLVL